MTRHQMVSNLAILVFSQNKSRIDNVHVTHGTIWLTKHDLKNIHSINVVAYMFPRLEIARNFLFRAPCAVCI